MNVETPSKLLALVATAVVAIVFGWVMTRFGRPPALPRALRAGYAPAEFPRHDLVEAPLLSSLCRSQASLLELYRTLPQRSAHAAELRFFLGEFRSVMDGAYGLARAADSTRLEDVVARANASAQHMHSRMALQVAESPHGTASAELETRLEVLNALARDPREL
jgi:hypothetical protein